MPKIKKNKKVNNQEVLQSKQLEELKRELREKNRELEISKSRYKNQKDVRRRAEEDSKQLKQEIENIKKLHIKELEGKELLVTHFKSELQLKTWESECHYEALGVAEYYKTLHVGELKEELEDSLELLHKAKEAIESQSSQIKDLQNELKGNQKLLDKKRKREESNEELQWQNSWQNFLVRRSNKKARYWNMRLQQSQSQKRDLIAKIEVHRK